MFQLINSLHYIRILVRSSLQVRPEGATIITNYTIPETKEQLKIIIYTHQEQQQDVPRNYYCENKNVSLQPSPVMVLQS